MKKIHYALYSIWAIISICFTTSCANSAKEDGLGHNHNHESGQHSDEIRLKPEDAEKFGVYTQMVKPKQFNEIIKVSGQITPAPGDQMTITAPSSGIITFSQGITEGKKIATGTIIASISSKDITGGDPNEAARIT